MQRERPGATVFRRLENGQAQSTTIAKAIQRMEELPDINVSDLAGELGYTPRHFRRIFRREVGIPPKDFIQIIRVRYILMHLDTKRNIRLTDLAYELGFSDQSHLNRVFKQFMGQSPRSYLERKRN